MIGKVNWNPSRKDLFYFGLVILIGFGVIGFVFRGVSTWLWSVAAAVFILSAVLPAAAKPLYFIWMAIGLVIGFVMSRIVMTIIFYLVLTPVSLVFKLKGRDELCRRKQTGPTYWHDHPVIDDKEYYRHLF